MIRNFIFAVGFFLILLGIQCFFVERFVFKYQNKELIDKEARTYQEVPCEFNPSPKAAWCLIFFGGSLVLYNLTSGGKK